MQETFNMMVREHFEYLVSEYKFRVGKILDHDPDIMLEALNEGLSVAKQVSVGSGGYEDYYPFYWEEYGDNYKEIRGDRVVFFITAFEKGTRTFAYYARATTDG